MGGKHQGFPHRTFVMFTIAEDDIAVVVLAVELGVQGRSAGNSHTLSQRAG